MFYIMAIELEKRQGNKEMGKAIVDGTLNGAVLGSLGILVLAGAALISNITGIISISHLISSQTYVESIFAVLAVSAIIGGITRTVSNYFYPILPVKSG